jgi:hypothetical protein
MLIKVTKGKEVYHSLPYFYLGLENCYNNGKKDEG